MRLDCTPVMIALRACVRRGVAGIAACAAVVALGGAAAPRAAGDGRVDPALVAAVKAGDTQAVERLVRLGTVVHLPEADGTTALHWAAHRDDTAMATVLLGAGAAAEVGNRYGVTPLMLAARNGSASMARLLLDAGADPRAARAEGETVLMIAAEAGSAATVTLLIERGAEVNARESWHGQTALMWAAAEGRDEAIRALAAGRADVHARSKGGFTALHFAARSGRTAAVEALLDAGANIGDTVQANTAPLPPPAMSYSFPRRNPGALGRGPTSEAESASALILAIANGHFQTAALLVERGADPNAAGQGWTPLHQVAWTRRPNRGKGLAPAAPNDALGSLVLARQLIARKADVNARVTRDPRDGNRHNWTRIGATPFVIAAFGGDLALMRLLLEHGADPTLATVDDVTALMAASGVGAFNAGEYGGTDEEALEAARLAIEGGNDVNAVDASGNTALHGVALRGANAVARLLAEKGARFDVRNHEGFTPLRIADGVFVTGTVKRQPETAALLRELMKARGVLRPEDAVPGVDVAVAERRR
jgi:ankyrin repeat protein